MPLITEEPVPLLTANSWTIADVQIDPAVPSVTYQVIAKLNGIEVRGGRTIVSVAREELIDSPEMVSLYETIKTLLYNDAKSRGHIPANAIEVQQ